MVRALTIAGALLAAGSGLMQMRSGDFAAGGRLARPLMASECGGYDRSPELEWSDAPRGTKSFALIMHDPDAPIPGGFYHWVAYDLPADTRRLPGSVKLPPSELGVTSAGKAGYYGPCPPAGPAHHYNFTLYALDVGRLAGHAPIDGAQLRRMIGGHVLARATLQGTASRL
jgi:Raf kinase inhibitor-like YbhB/YbcL family protein